MPAVAFFMSTPDPTLQPAVPFEALAPAVREQFNRAVDEGTTALTFGAAGINDALLYFSRAYDLHPNNERAVGGLETVADRLLVSIRDADVDAQREAFEVLYCHAYLRSYSPVASACADSPVALECPSIAARCGAAQRE
jgi:maltooligosyltrehalose synthase